MNKYEAIEKLNAIEKGDTEYAHIQADTVLIDFLKASGFADVAEAWEALEKRCNGFWYS